MIMLNRKGYFVNWAVGFLVLVGMVFSGCSSKEDKYIGEWVNDDKYINLLEEQKCQLGEIDGSGAETCTWDAEKERIILKKGDDVLILNIVEVKNGRMAVQLGDKSSYFYKKEGEIWEEIAGEYDCERKGYGFELEFKENGKYDSEDPKVDSGAWTIGDRRHGKEMYVRMYPDNPNARKVKWAYKSGRFYYRKAKICEKE